MIVFAQTIVGRVRQQLLSQLGFLTADGGRYTLINADEETSFD